MLSNGENIEPACIEATLCTSSHIAFAGGQGVVGSEASALWHGEGNRRCRIQPPCPHPRCPCCLPTPAPPFAQPSPSPCAVLVGQNRRGLGALLVPSPEAVEQFGQGDPQSPELRKLLQARASLLCTQCWAKGGG